MAACSHSSLATANRTKSLSVFALAQHSSHAVHHSAISRRSASSAIRSMARQAALPSRTILGPAGRTSQAGFGLPRGRSLGLAFAHPITPCGRRHPFGAPGLSFRGTWTRVAGPVRRTETFLPSRLAFWRRDRLDGQNGFRQPEAGVQQGGSPPPSSSVLASPSGSFRCRWHPILLRRLGKPQLAGHAVGEHSPLGRQPLQHSQRLHAPGFATRPMNSTAPVGRWRIRKTNGRSARKTILGSIGMAGSPSPPPWRRPPRCPSRPRPRRPCAARRR